MNPSPEEIKGERAIIADLAENMKPPTAIDEHRRKAEELLKRLA